MDFYESEREGARRGGGVVIQIDEREGEKKRAVAKRMTLCGPRAMSSSECVPEFWYSALSVPVINSLFRHEVET